MLQLLTDKEEIKLAHRKQDCTLPSFSQIMQGYCCPGWIEIPAETHGAARSTVVPQSVSIFSEDMVSYVFYLPWLFCLPTKKKKKIYTPVSTCWHLQMFLCSEKLHHFTLKLSAGIYHFACHRFTFYLYLNYMHSNTEVTSI